MSKSPEYVVVARRYRPQTFDELIGQQHVARGLKNAIAADRVGHAYLFTGARGVGKTSAARILAKALNCRQGPTPTPCNACDACESIASGDDVDVLEVDGASNRGIDEIRQLRQNVAVRPSRVRFKVYIIDEVHMLTREAFNALLKTLEEPPSHVKFIFATTEPQKVPITILSRCQRFDFSGIETAAIERRLAEIARAEGTEAEEEALALIARRAAGSMRDSQSLLEQLLAVADGVVTAADVNELLGTAPAVRIGEFAERVLSRDAPAALALLDAAVNEGTDIGQFWEQLSGFVRDVMVAAAGAPASQFLHALPSQEEQVRALAEGHGVHSILAVMQILDATAARMRTSIDPRTLAEMATIRICHLPDLQDLANMVAGLDAGDEGVGRGAASQDGGSKKKTPDPPAASSLRDEVERRLGPSRRMDAAHPTSPALDVPEGPLVQGVRELSPTLPPAQGTEAEPPALDSSPVHPAWNEGAVRQHWDQMRSGIDGMLADYLARVERVTSTSPGRIVGHFPARYSFFKQACEQQENRKRIEEGLAQAAGMKVSVEFDLVPESAPAPPPPKSRREVLREVAERPFVRKAVDLFADETAEIRYVPTERSGQ